MCLAVSTDDETIATVKAAVTGLQMVDNPDAFHESAVEYEIKKSGLNEADLAELGFCPADPVENEALVISDRDG